MAHPLIVTCLKVVLSMVHKNKLNFSFLEKNISKNYRPILLKYTHMHRSVRILLLNNNLILVIDYSSMVQILNNTIVI